MGSDEKARAQGDFTLVTEVIYGSGFLKPRHVLLGHHHSG